MIDYYDTTPVYHRRPRYDYDDDFDLSYSPRKTHSLVTSTLADNEMRTRASRNADARLMDNITTKLGGLDLSSHRSPYTDQDNHWRPRRRHQRASSVPPTPVSYSYTSGGSGGYTNYPRATGAHYTNYPGAGGGYAYIGKNYRDHPLHLQSTEIGPQRSGVYETISVVPKPKQRFETPEMKKRLDTLVDVDLPSASKALAGVRHHLQDVNLGLRTHRMMVDRHLALDLGTPMDVDWEVAKKYYELAERIPSLEPDRKFFHPSFIASEKNALNPALGYKERAFLPPTPTSDVRKRIRKVLIDTRTGA